jgi:large subunit ribosomal protein L19
VRRGKVRRAKLYYLRGLTGKAARITERARDTVVEAAPAAVAATAEAPSADGTPAAPKAAKVKKERPKKS